MPPHPEWPVRSSVYLVCGSNGSLWNLKYVEAEGIVEHFVKWFDRSPEEQFGRLQPLGRKLNYTLCLPFEHALYRLHVYTDLHISKHFYNPEIPDSESKYSDETRKVKEECEKLSNYMNYLKETYPSMLPISSVVDDGVLVPAAEAEPLRTIKGDRLKILENFEKNLVREPDSACPFELEIEPALVSDEVLKQSLEEIKEMWTRLLVFAAGKCSGELHARQLGDGLELLTLVWLLMIHHGLGDAAAEVKLLTTDDPSLPELGSLESDAVSNWGPRRGQPRYAFNFCRQLGAEAGMAMSRQRRFLFQQARQIDNILDSFQSSEAEQKGTITPSEKEQDQAGTSYDRDQ